MLSTRPAVSDAVQRQAGRIGFWIAVVFAIGLVTRFGFLALHGDVTSVDNYDQSVYYAAADAFISGRAPYRDFTLVHPPLLMLALTPFAAFGRLTSDPTGYQVAGLAWCVLGAANGALVTRVAARFGLHVGAAALGGVFYALWYGAVRGDVTPRLEPLGTFFFLLGLSALAGAVTRRSSLLAGIGLGAACCVKVWWLLALFVVLAWLLVTARERVLPLAAGALGTFVVVAGPFAALAPSQMLHMVILDQVGRPRNSPIIFRLRTLTTVWSGRTSVIANLQVALVVAIVVLAIVVALRHRAIRLVVVILVAQLFIVVLAPSYYGYYAGYPASALALTVAAASQPLFAARQRGRWLGWAAVGAVALAFVSTGTVVGAPQKPVAPIASAAINYDLRNVRCLISDTPEVLIALNRLSSDLERGCANWIDVTGRTLSMDKGRGSRTKSKEWQREIYAYLTSGDAVLIDRQFTDLSVATKMRIRMNPVISRHGGLTIYATPRATGTSAAP